MAGVQVTLARGLQTAGTMYFYSEPPEVASPILWSTLSVMLGIWFSALPFFFSQERRPV